MEAAWCNRYIFCLIFEGTNSILDMEDDRQSNCLSMLCGHAFVPGKSMPSEFLNDYMYSAAVPCHMQLYT